MTEPKPTYITSSTPLVAVDSFHLRILQQVAAGDLAPLDAARALAAHQARVVERALLGMAMDTALVPDVAGLVWIGTVDGKNDK